MSDPFSLIVGRVHSEDLPEEIVFGPKSEAK